jgi:uncharacterized membrane protein
MINEMNHGWGMGFSYIVILLIIGIIIWLIIKVLDQRRSLDQLNDKSPLVILKKRFVRGKISKKKFEKKKNIIKMGII